MNHKEFADCLSLAKEMLGTVGLLEDCTFRFSQWDPSNPKNKYEGTKEQWDYAQEVMGKILDDLGVEYTIGIDEAAFYGPKLDIQYKNVYGKEDTLVTIQIDMLLAERFGMEYVDVDGTKKRPYIIHRIPGIDAQRVALLDVVIQHGGKQVVRRADGVEITGEMQVDILNGHHLRVAAAGRAALYAEHGAQAWLAQRHGNVFTDA